MDIKDALAINSNGQIIDSLEHDVDVEEYLVIDLFCLKGLLKNIFSIKKNSIKVCLKVFFKSKYFRSTSSLASFLNLSIFDLYRVFDDISQRSNFEIDSKNSKIILLLTTIK
tara:strand:- start:225 stop:560 length:336 start_codon:yes stop_codon:yes gene_type:complete